MRPCIIPFGRCGTRVPSTQDTISHPPDRLCAPGGVQRSWHLLPPKRSRSTPQRNASGGDTPLLVSVLLLTLWVTARAMPNRSIEETCGQGEGKRMNEGGQISWRCCARLSRPRLRREEQRGSAPIFSKFGSCAVMHRLVSITYRGERDQSAGKCKIEPCEIGIARFSLYYIGRSTHPCIEESLLCRGALYSSCPRQSKLRCWLRTTMLAPSQRRSPLALLKSSRSGGGSSCSDALL